ncbi:unnamed protein product, partial [marine sediment metagenome]
NGAQNGGIRRFDQLKNVKIWKFDKDLFNIHNICFFGEKGTQNPALNTNPILPSSFR